MCDAAVITRDERPVNKSNNNYETSEGDEEQGRMYRNSNDAYASWFISVKSIVNNANLY